MYRHPPQSDTFPRHTEYLRPTERPAPVGERALSGTIDTTSTLWPPSTVGDEPIETYAKTGSPYAGQQSEPTERPADEPRAVSPEEPAPPRPTDSKEPPIKPPTESPVPSPQPEEPQPPLDIRRSPTATLIVSTTHPDPELAEQVAQTVSEGIPETWQQIDTDGTSPGFFTDSPNNPKFFAKIISTKESRMQSLDRAWVNTRIAQPYENEISHFASARSGEAISSEMRMAPKIQKVLQDPKMQRILDEHGYKDIQLIAPLVAGIEHGTGHKFLVYPWQEGRVYPRLDNPKWPPHTQVEAAHLSDIADKLEFLLDEHLIEPYEFTRHNLMVTTDPSGGRHLHLFDITAFMRAKRQLF